MDFEKNQLWESLVNDESFQDWVLNRSDTGNDEHWEKWEIKNSENADVLESAKHFILHFQGSDEVMSKNMTTESWLALKTQLNKENGFSSHTILRNRFRYNSLFRYAAMLAILLVAIGSVYFWNFKSGTELIVFETEFGEKQEVVLPDGSKVILNANSRISYPEVDSGFKREINLEKGEAFFEVAKTTSNEHFLVLTNQLTIEVLGTRFNVNMRTRNEKVMLLEGSVLVKDKLGLIKSMKPGELAELNDEGRILINAEDSKSHVAWLDNKVFFQNTTLMEVANFIESHYNVKVELEPSLRQQTISGELPNNNLNLLLDAIRISHELKIIHKDNSITIDQ